MPGGFGYRGVEGKIRAIRWARRNNVPFLGLCLGLQCAVIEFAREALGTDDANSSEFNVFTEHPVIDLMPDQADVTDKGGTMRLGLYPARLEEGSRVRDAYGAEIAYERHRHRFEVNNAYRDRLSEARACASAASRPMGGWSSTSSCATIPWFVATQAHPELKSRPNRPHPLFRDFVGAAAERLVARSTRPRRVAHARAASAERRGAERSSAPRAIAHAGPRLETPELDARSPMPRRSAIVVWRGERIPFTAVPERIARTRRPRRARAASTAAYRMALEALNPLYRERHAAWRSGQADAGTEDLPQRASDRIEALALDLERLASCRDHRTTRHCADTSP